MRGEYKVPGGKLVIADFDLEGGRLANVSINGDFFLEPPEALDDICGSLEGASADETEEELAERIRVSLNSEVEMVGFSPGDVAVAVKRGLS